MRALALAAALLACASPTSTHRPDRPYDDGGGSPMPALARAAHDWAFALNDTCGGGQPCVISALTLTATPNALKLTGGAKVCFNAACTTWIGDDGFGTMNLIGQVSLSTTGLFSTLTAFALSTGATLRHTAACNSTASPGAATCNQGAGRASIAGAAASVVITDSFATAGSIIHADLQTNDGTCTSIKSVIPASGSFTVAVNAACTGTTNFGWTLTNP